MSRNNNNNKINNLDNNIFSPLIKFGKQAEFTIREN